MASADHLERDLLAWSLLAGLILLAGLAGPYFAGRVYTRDDLGAFHLPIRAFYAEQLARDEPFDWMPQLYSGFYLTGEGQAGTYHPLHLLLYRYLPLPAATGCEWLASYPFMLAGTWLLLRRRLKRSDAAMLGSLLFTFSGFNLLHFFHPNAVAVVAHIPWLLWAIDIALVGSSRGKVRSAEAAVALLTGSQLLLGYPQYVWFSLLAEVAYAGFVLAARKQTARQSRDGQIPGRECAADTGSRWARCLVAKGCGLLLGGVQLLPTVDALTQSARQSADATFADWGSLHPLNLVQLVAPYMFADRVVGKNTQELGLYVGAVPLMLVVWLVVRRRRLGTLRPLAWASGGFGLLALLMAFGKYGPLYRMQRYLPWVGDFRFPCRFLVLFDLAVAVLAALGFVLLLRDHQRSRHRHGNVQPAGEVPPRTRPWRRFGALGMVVAGSGLIGLAGLGLQRRPSMASVPDVLAGPFLMGTAALLLASAARGGRAALVGLILFAAADLGVYGLSFSVYPGAARLEPFLQSIASTAPPAADPNGRVLASLIRFDRQGLRIGNQMTLVGWHRADGYAGLPPRQRLDYRRLAALRVAGVRWVRYGDATAEIRGLLPRGRRWLEVPQPLPRVRLLSRAQASRDPARDLGRINVESTALTEVPLALPEGTPGTAAVLSERPGRLHIQCDCATVQLLVVSESFHPGWQAIVEGRPRHVFRVNGDFMGCLVGPGAQRVVLEFRPPSLRRGWIVSCLGLGLLSICLIANRPYPSSRPLENELR